MLMRSPLVHVAILIVVLVFIFPCALIFINTTLLDSYHKKYQTVFKNLPEYYKPDNFNKSDTVLSQLKKLNLKCMEDFSLKQPISFLYQYDSDWKFILSHSTSTSSKHHIRIISEEIINAIKDRDIYFLNLGHHLLLKYTHTTASPLKYTVIAVNDEGFFRQKNILLASVIVLLFVLLGAFSVLLLFPWKNNAKHNVKKKKERSFNDKKSEMSDYLANIPLDKTPTTKKSSTLKKDLFVKFNSKGEATKVNTSWQEDSFVAEGSDLMQTNNKNNYITKSPDPPIPEDHNIRSFSEIFKYKQQLENQIQNLAIVKEIKLASQFIPNVDGFLESIITLIHKKMPGDRVEVFLNHPTDSQFLTASSFLTLKSTIENEKVTHYSPEINEQIPKLLLNIGEEGRCLSRLQGVILKQDGSHILSVPLIDRLNITGAIRLISHREKIYTNDEKFIMEKLAKHIAEKLNGVTLQGQLKEVLL